MCVQPSNYEIKNQDIGKHKKEFEKCRIRKKGSEEKENIQPIFFETKKIHLVYWQKR